jgi:hypothetical protein
MNIKTFDEAKVNQFELEELKKKGMPDNVEIKCEKCNGRGTWGTGTNRSGGPLFIHTCKRCAGRGRFVDLDAIEYWRAQPRIITEDEKRRAVYGLIKTLGAKFARETFKDQEDLLAIVEQLMSSNKELKEE